MRHVVDTNYNTVKTIKRAYAVSGVYTPILIRNPAIKNWIKFPLVNGILFFITIQRNLRANQSPTTPRAIRAELIFLI